MRYFLHIVILLLWSTQGCKSPSYQTVTTKFNVFFYAKKYFLKATENQSDAYEFDILSNAIINLNIFKDLPKESLDYLEKSEKKLMKIIKEKDNEDNDYVDDTYLMLAQIYFIKKLYGEALDLLNYAQANFSKSKLIPEIRYWTIKTKIKMGNMIHIEKSLKIIFKDRRIKGKLREGIARTYAHFLIYKKQYSKAINVLKIALGSSKNSEDRATLHYALGQLYLRDGDPDQSISHYQKVVDIYPENYTLYLFSQLALIDIDQKRKGSIKKYLNRIDRLLQNEKNKNTAYLLNYKYATLLLKTQKRHLAAAYFSRVIQDKNTPKKLKQECYEKIGDLYFYQNKYERAYNHFDTALTLSKKNQYKTTSLTEKRDNLKTLKHYTDIVKKSDSIILLHSMSTYQRKQYFKNLHKKRQKKIYQGTELNETHWDNIAISNFYFYNLSNVKRGIKSFREKYGVISLSDNWFDKTSNHISKSPREKKINTDSLARHSKVSEKSYADATQKKHYAMYYLAVLYGKKFSQYELSYRALTEILSHKYQNEQLKVAVYFHLMTAAKKMGNEKQATYYKELLLKKYPNSDYTALAIKSKSLLNQNTQEENDLSIWLSRSLSFIREGNYLRAVRLANKAMKEYPLDAMKPRFELIKAISMYHLNDLANCKRILEKILNTYPNTPSSNKASDLLKKLS